MCLESFGFQAFCELSLPTVPFHKHLQNFRHIVSVDANIQQMIPKNCFGLERSSLINKHTQNSVHVIAYVLHIFVMRYKGENAKPQVRGTIICQHTEMCLSPLCNYYPRTQKLAFKHLCLGDLTVLGFSTGPVERKTWQQSLSKQLICQISSVKF